MRGVEFIVYGVAAPQGSKNPFGGESNPRTRPWRAAVTAEAARAMEGSPPIDGPVKVTATFYFTRPKKHYRTGKFSHVLRDDAPTFHTTTPDLDKLQRAIGDALTGVALRDDSLIAWWGDPKKLYADTARAEITIEAL